MEVGSLYTQFSHSLLGYIRSKIRSKEDAEDILQNIFTRISLNVNTLAEKEKIQNWLFTVTRNAIIDYYRANASKRYSNVDDALIERIADERSADEGKGLLDQCLFTMIDLLPEEYRYIIIDSEIKGIAQKELAEKYSMAYSSMRSRVQRGRERLKQLFYNCCHIQTDVRGNVLEATKKGEACGGPCSPCGDDDSVN